MSLTRGDLIGNYEIIERLGAGAMGEVYRARDQRLGRDVAIKVLQDELAANPDRRARFEKEARVAAALNHPNILGLFDIGEHAGRLYFVTELIEGKTLRQRMGQGTVPVKELYRIALQLADGMAAAHAASVVHRDLKPENIMLTADGRLKILDFGLARQGGATDADATATLAYGVTQPGTLLGTATYMSPQQARGEAVDYRSDQFSFGVILYELVTGVSPFHRGTAVQTMSAVLTDEPKRIEAGAPVPLRWTIARCLEKDAAGRYDSTRDLYQELRSQQEYLSEVFHSVAAPLAAKPKPRTPWVWLAAAVLLAVALVTWGVGRSAGTARLRYTPMEVTWANPSPAVWSPDGKSFAYSADVAKVRQVFVRYLDAQTPVQLTKGPETSVPVGWSPDSKRVVVSSKNPKSPDPPQALFSIPVTGGEPEFVMPLLFAPAARISPDGRILSVLGREPDGVWGLYTASPVGTPLQRYLPSPIHSKSFTNRPDVQFAPGNTAVLLSIDLGDGRQFWRFPLPAGGEKPVRILEGKLDVHGGTPQINPMPDGRFALASFQENFDEENYHLWMLDLQSGQRNQITAGTGNEANPQVSADGSRLLFSSGRAEFRIVSLSLADGTAETVIASDRTVSMPAWARAQEKFTYVSSRNGAPAIWVRENGVDRPLVTASAFPANQTRWFMTPSLSPDGGRVIYSRVGIDNQRANWITAVSGGPPIKLTPVATKHSEGGGSWSPDGNRYAYLIAIDGGSSLAVSRTNGDSPVEILRKTITGLRLPEWSPDGKWIKYFDAKQGWNLVSPDGKVEQVLGMKDAIDLTFSKDSARMYGIQKVQGRLSLFSFELTSKIIKNISPLADDLEPLSPLRPGIRLSLSPDGKRILYPTIKYQSGLWMLEGFQQPGWLGR